MMSSIFLFSFWASLLSLLTFLVLAARNFIKKNTTKVVSLVATGTFISSMFIQYPSKFSSGPFTIRMYIQNLLISVYDALNIFLLKGKPEQMLKWSSQIENPIYETVTSWLMLFLCFAAPIMTLSVVLSFFRHTFAYMHMLTFRKRDLYVFPTISKKNLIIARSIIRKHKKENTRCTILFTNSERKRNISDELFDKAHDIGALTIRNGFDAIKPGSKLARGNISWFAMGEDEMENVANGISIMNLTRNCMTDKSLMLYVMTTSAEGELILKTEDNTSLRIRRISRSRSTIERCLYEDGTKLFRHATEPDETGTRTISVVIAGLGKYGKTMLRTLAWACQMDGYFLKVNVYDKDPAVISRFKATSPDLLSPDHNGNREYGDAAYSITFHPGVSTESEEFRNELLALDCVTYVFVAIGSDKANIKASTRIREICNERGDGHGSTESGSMLPDITTPLYDTPDTDRLNYSTNSKGQSYDIKYIGAWNEAFSIDTFTDSIVEKQALLKHLSVTDKDSEESFWKYEYNHSSSVAYVIHVHLMEELEIPYVEAIDRALASPENMELQKLADEAYAKMRVQEHNRWNAWMRSSGWRWSGSIERSSRSDIGKIHNLLVPFGMLPPEEQEKDEYIPRSRRRELARQFNIE